MYVEQKTFEKQPTVLRVNKKQTNETKLINNRKRKELTTALKEKTLHDKVIVDHWH